MREGFLSRIGTQEIYIYIYTIYLVFQKNKSIENGFLKPQDIWYVNWKELHVASKV
jgi:hypothetical protein